MTTAAKKIAEAQAAKDKELAATLGIPPTAPAGPATLSDHIFELAGLVDSMYKTARIAHANSIKLIEVALNYQLGLRSIAASTPQYPQPTALQAPEIEEVAS